MTIEEFLCLFQKLCSKHPEINGFYTGTKSNHDDNNTQYPAVRMVFPFEIIPNLDTEVQVLKVEFSVRVKNAQIDVGGIEIDQTINYLTESDSINELDTAIQSVNKKRNKAAELALHLIWWLRLSEDNYNYFSVKKALVKGVEKADADGVTGANVYLDLAIGNPYICQAKNLFLTYVQNC